MPRITIRPVTYEEHTGKFRTVTDARGIGTALMMYCDPDDPAYQRAAEACLDLEGGSADAEQVRSDFIAALEAAGVFVRLTAQSAPDLLRARRRLFDTARTTLLSERSET